MTKLLVALALLSCGGKQPSSPSTQDTTKDQPHVDGGAPVGPLSPKTDPVPGLDPTIAPSGPTTSL